MQEGFYGRVPHTSVDVDLYEQTPLETCVTINTDYLLSKVAEQNRKIWDLQRRLDNANTVLVYDCPSLSVEDYRRFSEAAYPPE